MDEPQKYQIVIVGGGPAGLSAALSIADRLPAVAKSLLILEAAEHPRPKVCGGGITFHGEEQIKQLGLQIDVPAFYVQRMRFQLGAQSFTTLCRNAMRIVQRSEFDAALANAVTSKRLALRSNEPLLDIEPRNHDVLLTTSKARYAAKVVVAADGANSTVRRKLGLRSVLGVARLLRVLQPVSPAQMHIWKQKTALFDFSCVQKGIQGYSWDFPCYVDHQPCMNHGIFESRLDPDVASANPHGHLKSVFTDYLKARGIEFEQVEVKGHPVRWFNPDAEFARPRVLLAGDAGGVDPLFAEGISYAMEYGQIVAETVEDAFATDDFSFRHYRKRLLEHHMSRSLLRRAWVAKHLYQYRHPWFWSWLWRAASIAPRSVNQSVGAALDVLPPVQIGHSGVH